METKNESGISLRGAFFIPETNEAIRDNVIYKLKPKEMDVFILLYNNIGHTISRDLILEKVWGSSYGNDLGLTQAVSSLRRILKDNPKDAKVIKTIPKKGYQMIGENRFHTMNHPSHPPKYSVLKQSFISALMTLVFLLLILFSTVMIVTPKISIRVQKEAIHDNRDDMNNHREVNRMKTKKTKTLSFESN